MPNAAASRLLKGSYNEDAVICVAQELLAQVGGKVSCAFAFVSADYREQIDDFLELVQLHGHVPTIVGCSGGGLITSGKEAEGSSGFSLLFLHLPETTLYPVSFTEAEVNSISEPEAWRKAAGVRPEDVDGWLLLADPSNTPVEPWLNMWNAAYPNVPTIGGLASGGESAEEDIFVFHDRELVESVVALGFKGGIRIESVLSQGCRPIGEALPVTGADRNIITTLGSRPAYERLVEAIEGLSPLEKGLASEGNLFVGLAMSEYIDEFKTGDFLVRNILAADPDSGALAVAALPRVGQTLEFQLRDRHSAHEELQRLLLAKRRARVKPFASLLFSCSGRGRFLFGEADHDSGAVADYFGHHPSAGFFCNGEIGPVGGRNFVHGYTASIALLVDA